MIRHLITRDDITDELDGGGALPPGDTPLPRDRGFETHRAPTK